MLPFYTLWSQWSDQLLDAGLDFAQRSRKLQELSLGEPAKVAQTPSEVVYRENKMRLLHYLPSREGRYASPVLLVPSIINRYYILDLKPGRSIAEHLRDQGFDVWMIAWGNPGPEDRFVTFDEHIDGYLLRAVERVLKSTGQPALSLLGYCIGGVLTTIFAALHGKYIRNLITLTSPINFHDDGLLSLWARKESFPVDLLVDTYGNMPDWLLQTSFKWLRPTSGLSNAMTLWERLDNPDQLDDFRALNHWVEDNVSVAGETYRKFVKDCYQENLLVQNRLTINGRRVNLGDIDCALLNVVARKDHICPCDSASVLNEMVSSQDKTLLTLPGGHIGAIVGRDARHTFWPQMVEWLGKRSDAQGAQ